MSGIVLELQKDALNSHVNVADLTRKALAVSKKLGQKQIEEWLYKELNGYGDSNEEIPSYREVQGEIKYQNPFHGWQPVIFSDPRMNEQLSKRKVGSSIGELNSLINRDTSGELGIPFPQKIAHALMNAMPAPMVPYLIVDKSSVAGILEAVKNNILDWALQLEKEGIIGEGMSFSIQEKKKAEKASYQVTYNIGSMQNSQLQHESPGADQTLYIQENIDEIAGIVSKIRSSMDQFSLSLSNQKELLAEISTIEFQSRSPNPKPSIIKECLQTIHRILEGATGNVLASGLINDLAKFL